MEVPMWVRCVILGLSIMLFGVFIWKKQMIRMIWSYYYINVSEENKKIYTKRIGQSIILLGLGGVLYGVIDHLTMDRYGIHSCFACVILSRILFYHTQRKYNGKWLYISSILHLIRRRISK